MLKGFALYVAAAIFQQQQKKKNRKKSGPSLELVELTTRVSVLLFMFLVFVSSVCYVGVSDNISERGALQVY